MEIGVVCVLSLLMVLVLASILYYYTKTLTMRTSIFQCNKRFPDADAIAHVLRATTHYTHEILSFEKKISFVHDKTISSLEQIYRHT